MSLILPSLYPHQQELEDKTRAALLKHRSVVLCAMTGVGKTRLAKRILAKAASLPPAPNRSGRVLFCVHRRGLVFNCSESFNQDPPVPHGVIMSGVDAEWGHSIQVGSVDSLLSWFIDDQYRGNYTYDFVCYDECVAGDSVIETEMGSMRIDEVPIKKPKLVKSIDGYQRILDWKQSGFRETLTVQTELGSFNCTPEHEVYTDHGWTQARHLTEDHFIYVDADVEALHPSPKDASLSTSQMIHTCEECMSSTSTETNCASAAADRRQSSHITRTRRGRSIRTQCNTENLRKGTQTLRAIKTTNSQKKSAKLFLELFLGTRAFASQSRTGHQDLVALTESASRSGRSTRHGSSRTLTCRHEKQRTPDMESDPSALEVRACRALKRCMGSSGGEGESELRRNGLTKSGISALHGGYAMTDLTRKTASLCTQKASPRKRTNSSRTGYATTLEQQNRSATAQKTNTSSMYPALHRLRSTMPSRDSSPSACDIRFSKVVQVVKGWSTFVYDIAVENTHCFFANKHLVHNCHSHLTKLKTFLDAHSIARERLGLHEPWTLGLSATPSAKGLSDVFSDIVYGPSAQWLTDNNFMKRYKYFRGSQGKVSLLKKSGDEFTEASIAACMDGMAGHLVRDWLKLGKGRSTVGFFNRRANAREAVDLLQAAGVKAMYLDGEVSDEERKRMFDLLNTGEIDYIANVGIVERGTDIPRIGCVQLCTAIGSIARYIQIAGRGARPHPEVEDCILIDHAQNIKRHGFVTDEIRWSLDWTTRPSKTHSARPSVECPQCDAQYRGGLCSNCGYQPQPKELKAQGLLFDGTELMEVAPKDTGKKAKSPEDYLISALFRAGRTGKTFGSAIFMARQAAQKDGVDFRVPKTFTVAGKKYRSIPFGDKAESSRKVQDTYPFSVGNYRELDNPYFVEPAQPAATADHGGFLFDV